MIVLIRGCPFLSFVGDFMSLGQGFFLGWSMQQEGFSIGNVIRELLSSLVSLTDS